MPEPNATLGGEHGREISAMTHSIAADKNDPQFRGTSRIYGDANLRREPMGYVYIYNVSPLEHKIERPWVSECFVDGKPLGKNVILRACAAGEEYSRPFVIPDPLQEVSPRIAGSPEMIAKGVDAKFYAQDAICPDQPHGDWRTLRPMNAAEMGGEGTNLYKLGAFWSTSNPPEPEAVAKAKERLTQTFNAEIRAANALAAANKAHEITNLQHFAADYLHVNVPWHQKYRPEMECPGCGDYVPAGIARHMKQDCKWVFDWDRAIAGGQATVKEAVAAGARKAE